MGGAPVIEEIRPGVSFVPEAALAFRRLEARLGRRADVNRTYADYDTQMSMYLAWTAWVHGVGPKPAHSRALHPDLSMHCRGVAWDSDDWRTVGFITLAAEYGFIRTAAGDPSEQHHFEYQSWNDKHYGEKVDAMSAADVWNYPITRQGKKLRTIDDLVDTRDALARVELTLSDIRRDGQKVTMRDDLVETGSIARRTLAAVEALAKSVSTGGVTPAQVKQIADAVIAGMGKPIDYAALARAVNDDAARRMAG
ncbi:hypothetical protein [Microbacterium sp. J1-1]|uniref:hypothetical protein n=1 Tax=Microbacterium sp. J1-1 TaxID=2992441 RepID=UPI0021158CFD|nr:hypothetical protein [Microbacterium sp. J1-1]UUE19316.1 hypothetical protein LRQ07_10895 [Microbacterium sp. J1-1]